MTTEDKMIMRQGMPLSGEVMKRKRGRPSRIDPCAKADRALLYENCWKVKRMARAYASGYDCAYAHYFCRNRPLLLQRVQTDDRDIGQTGRIRYSKEILEKLPKEDRVAFDRYVRAREEMHFLEQGVAGIEDERTREIAEDTLLEGIRCADLTEKYGMTERGIRKRKHRALETLALQWMDFDSDNSSVSN